MTKLTPEQVQRELNQARASLTLFQADSGRPATHARVSGRRHQTMLAELQEAFPHLTLDFHSPTAVSSPDKFYSILPPKPALSNTPEATGRVAVTTTKTMQNADDLKNGNTPEALGFSGVTSNQAQQQSGVDPNIA